LRTLAQFKEAMQPSLDAHATVLGLRNQLCIAIQEREGLVGKAIQILYVTGSRCGAIRRTGAIRC